MDELARRESGDRAAVFRKAAAERGLPPPHIEKDFWVCWTLRRLFAPALVDGMVFKGGTSLSKVWGAIHRFSEDIDLTLPRVAIPGAKKVEIGDEQSVTQRKRSKERLDGLLAEWCAGLGLMEVRARIRVALGSDREWTIRSAADSMEFEYPEGLPAAEYGGGYVRRLVRLEYGMVMPTEPAEDHRIQPYATQAGDYRMGDPDVRVHVLGPERTFWEKATLVHSENNRPAPKAADRVSRHYADIAALLPQEIGHRAVAQMQLLPQVAQEKERYFHTGWADYGEAARGRLRLVPPKEHERALRRDYAAMRDMYYGEVIPFDMILERLTELQEIVAHHALFQQWQ